MRKLLPQGIEGGAAVMQELLPGVAAVFLDLLENPIEDGIVGRGDIHASCGSIGVGEIVTC